MGRGHNDISPKKANIWPTDMKRCAISQSSKKCKSKNHNEQTNKTTSIGKNSPGRMKESVQVP